MSLPRLSPTLYVGAATAMFFLAVVLSGLLSLPHLAVDLLPDLNYRRRGAIAPKLPQFSP